MLNGETVKLWLCAESIPNDKTSLCPSQREFVYEGGLYWFCNIGHTLGKDCFESKQDCVNRCLQILRLDHSEHRLQMSLIEKRIHILRSTWKKYPKKESD